MRPLSFIPVTALALAASCATPAVYPECVELAGRDPGDGPRVLCVVAHPDDEIGFAATLYKTSSLLAGACDVVLVTNGEGGFKYASLSEDVYDLELTDEAVGRANLPSIRKAEFLAGCRLMGVRRTFFLDQRDHRYTQDPEEVIGPQGVWDAERVITSLQEILTEGRYDFLLTLAPTPATHGHHKAATMLALRACERLAADVRPVALCVQHSAQGEALPAVPGLAGYPITRVRSDVPPFLFDRTQGLGYRGALNYKIIANWAIAEHKSQGTMQLAAGRGDYEHYYLFELNASAAATRASDWFEALRAPQFESKVYSASAGTNAGTP